MAYETDIQQQVDYITKSYLRNVIQIAVFYTGNDKIYGINISKIQTFLIKEETEIVKTPSSDDLVVGLINLRGEYISVVNFDHWIGDEVDEDVFKIIIVCNYNERKIGILVKDIIKIEEKSAEELVIPQGEDPKISYITTVNIDGKEENCIIFDAEKLLSDANIESKTTIYDIQALDKFPPINSDKWVLVAEDSKTVIEKLKKFFDIIKVKYRIFENGKDLVDSIHDFDPEEIGLIITDIEMPIMNGFQVIKYLKESERYRHLPIISLTSMTTQGIQDKVSKLGAEGLINKANFKELYKQIKFHLER
ncbi:MAG: response regulator [Epsilonproteobacteria bacterium]|nr:response regulator [Campylobacterota bacterium]